MVSARNSNRVSLDQRGDVLIVVRINAHKSALLQEEQKISARNLAH
jgi:hypothetical protein